MVKMRRLTAYVTGSVALATTVISYAFYERPNFYSAAVYLSQSSACLLVLSNLALLIFLSTAYALQQIVFGQLRPIEIEQLYERGWIAATEWLFAMSIFRDEFGPWYMTMFLILFFGKVWGWLSDGRIEILEQQEPRNPRLFHARLCVALALYALGAGAMLRYCLEEVIYEARPGVMIMFVFEWAIICISVISTFAKYCLWSYERKVLTAQEKTRREELLRETPDLNEADIDVNDLDLPGWEKKGSFMFALDIIIDLLKLIAYIAFFCVLTVFYGIPIYIIRDLYMTMRSFIRRVTDYIKYETATRDMHTLYPDATAAELATDNTCIVCREEMHPWEVNLALQDAANPPPRTVSERNRPKKLPCGHILHFHCLRSWLERQQACPICRRSVLRPTPTNAQQAGNRPQQPGQQQPPQPGAQGAQQGFNFQFGNFRLQLRGGIQFGQEAPPPPNHPQQLPPAAAAAAPIQANPMAIPLQQPPPAPTPTQPANNIGTAPQPSAATSSSSAAAAAVPPVSGSALFQLPNVDEAFPSLQSAQPLIRDYMLHTQLDAIESYLWHEVVHARAGIDRVNHLRQLQASLSLSRRTMNEHATANPSGNHLLSGPLALQPTQEPSNTLIIPRHGSNNNNSYTASVRLPPGWSAVPLSRENNRNIGQENNLGTNNQNTNTTTTTTPTLNVLATSNLGTNNQNTINTNLASNPASGPENNNNNNTTQSSTETSSAGNQPPRGGIHVTTTTIAGPPFNFEEIARLAQQNPVQLGAPFSSINTVNPNLNPQMTPGPTFVLANNMGFPDTAMIPGVPVATQRPDVAEFLRQAHQQARQDTVRLNEQIRESSTRLEEQAREHQRLWEQGPQNPLLTQYYQRISDEIRSAGSARGSRQASPANRSPFAHPPYAATVNIPPPNSTTTSPLREGSPQREAEAQAVLGTQTDGLPPLINVQEPSPRPSGTPMTSSWSFSNITQTGSNQQGEQQAVDEGSRGRPRPVSVEDVPDEEEVD